MQIEGKGDPHTHTKTHTPLFLKYRIESLLGPERGKRRDFR